MFQGRHKKYEKVVAWVAENLGPWSGQKSIEDASGSINTLPLGYVFGFADAACFAHNLKINSEYGDASLEALLETFWPGNGKRYLKVLTTNVDDSDLINAAGYGRSDCLQMLKNNDAFPAGFPLTILAVENPEARKTFEENVRKIKKQM